MRRPSSKGFEGSGADCVKLPGRNRTLHVCPKLRNFTTTRGPDVNRDLGGEGASDLGGEGASDLGGEGASAGSTPRQGLILGRLCTGCCVSSGETLCWSGSTLGSISL